MWRNVSGEERKKYQDRAAVLMKNPAAFKSAMRDAIAKWRYSCEHNLTARSVNRIAWLGHAGCCVAVESPEDVTRAAWWTLTQGEQDEANRVAAEVLKEWEDLFLSSVPKVNRGT